MTTTDVVWTPAPDAVDRCDMGALMREVGVADYNELWEWSVADLPRFWRTIWDRYDVQADGDPTVVLESHEMPGAHWFPDVALSFPEHVFRGRDPDATALYYASESGPPSTWTWGDLRDRVARIRAGLVELGVGPGDRVVGYLPNIPETVAAFLAVASLSAVWSCCSPDYGARTVIERFGQIEPRVLLAVDGYRYAGMDHDRRDVVAEVEAALPTLEHTVRLSFLGSHGDWYDVFAATEQPLTFERVPFEHPLWVVFSSGTTGLPKPIVHGHGGPLLEHLKLWRLHHAVRAGDRVMWYTTTGWIMWNYLVCALLSDASVVLYDGSPSYPDLGVLWDVADAVNVDVFGAGAAYYHGCIETGVAPRAGRSLSRLRQIGSTGSPLAPAAYDWIAAELGDVWLVSNSGGTDVASAFVGGSPLMNVERGELPARMLGVAIEVWDDDGRPVVDEVGELVVTKPMPSMPIFLWGDRDHERYRATYFSHFPGVWRQGDWIRMTSRGSAVIYGRSDSTINRGGIRLGTAEIYSAVGTLGRVADAIVVDVPPSTGFGESRIWLFVALSPGAALTDDLIAEINRAIVRHCSRRHRPDEVVSVPEIPRTVSGKPLEVPVKRLLMGHRPEAVVQVGTLANPDAWEWFVQFARRSR